MDLLLGLLPDIPKIPEEVLPPVETILEQPRIDRGFKGMNNPYFMPKNIHDEPLLEWLELNILTRLFGTKRAPDHKHFHYQVLNTGFPIHIDRYNRRVGLNYLLKLGGDDVHTLEYSNDGKVVRDSAKFKLHEWHWLVTEIPHVATNITSPRLAISVMLRRFEEDEFFARVGYKPLEIPLLKDEHAPPPKLSP